MGNIKTVQAVILGGGLVGLALAKGLIDRGISVAVIEKNQPKLAWGVDEKDLRVSAINRFSESLLDALGVWQMINQHQIAPFNQMYVFDEGSDGQIKMNAYDIAERELGFIIENRIIIKALWQSLNEKNAPLYSSNVVEKLNRLDDAWQLQLSDGSLIRTELLIGADGANSWLRSQFDFQLKKRPYNQHAIVAEVKTEYSHKNCATQRFLSTGPLAFLPLNDPFHSSIVWSLKEKEALCLMSVDDQAFNDALTKAFDGYLGTCEVQSKRVKFPLVEQHINHYVKEGVVLLGDAAHVIHPLAGQGVNQGFKDVDSLIKVLDHAHKKGRSLSDLSTLKQYERERKWHNQLMIWMMAAFKSGFSNESKILGFLRGKGLSLVDRKALLKRFFMTQAMGKKRFIIMFKTEDFDYKLPNELIASYPTEKRDHSRLLVLDRQAAIDHEIKDQHFFDLPNYLNAGDLLVFNNSKVMAARLFGHKASGGKVELLIERILDDQSILSHLRASRKPKIGEMIKLDEGIQLELIAKQSDHLFELKLRSNSTAQAQTIWQVMELYGHIPLPPYMQREDKAIDIERYQTIYSQPLGSVAAPTAGLHFTDQLIEKLADKGVNMAYVTLHVGSGTFQPVKASDLSQHKMHSEVIEVSESVVEKIIQTKKAGNKVIAVGTTTVRSLETAALSEEIKPFVGETDIFLYPGKKFNVVDKMITNFHLPKSTLIMLVSAFAGRDLIKRAYAHAVLERYRFFSYGDAMLIL